MTATKTVSFKTKNGQVSFKARPKAPKVPKSKAPKAPKTPRGKVKARGPKRVKIEQKPVTFNTLSSRGNTTPITIEVMPARADLVPPKAINPKFGKFSKWFKARRVDSPARARRAAKDQVEAAKKTIAKGIKASKAPRSVKKAQIKQLERQAKAAVVAVEATIQPVAPKIKTRPRSWSTKVGGTRMEAAIKYGLTHKISIDALADRFAVMDVDSIKDGIRQAKRSAKASERAAKSKKKALKSHRWKKEHPKMNEALQKYNMLRHAEKMMKSGHMVTGGGEVEIGEQVDATYDSSLTGSENIQNYDRNMRDAWRGEY